MTRTEQESNLLNKALQQAGLDARKVPILLIEEKSWLCLDSNAPARALFGASKPNLQQAAKILSQSLSRRGAPSAMRLERCRFPEGRGETWTLTFVRVASLNVILVAFSDPQVVRRVRPLLPEYSPDAGWQQETHDAPAPARPEPVSEPAPQPRTIEAPQIAANRADAPEESAFSQDDKSQDDKNAEQNENDDELISIPQWSEADALAATASEELAEEEAQFEGEEEDADADADDETPWWMTGSFASTANATIEDDESEDNQQNAPQEDSLPEGAEHLFSSFDETLEELTASHEESSDAPDEDIMSEIPHDDEDGDYSDIHNAIAELDTQHDAALAEDNSAPLSDQAELFDEDQASEQRKAQQEPQEEETPELFSLDRPMRFLWEIDAGNRFTAVSPELALVVGAAKSSIIGLPWEDVVQRLHIIDPNAFVERALARRETWSSLQVLWPTEGRSARYVSIELSGLAMFDAGRRFRGFRGFGIIRPLSEQQAQSAEVQKVANGDSVVVAPISHIIPQHQQHDHAITAFSGDFSALQTSTPQTAESDAPSVIIFDQPAEQNVPEDVMLDIYLPMQEEGQETSKDLNDETLAAVDHFLQAEDIIPSDEKQIDETPAEDEPTQNSKVITLRRKPGDGARLVSLRDEDPIKRAELMGQTPLSHNEQSAFQEIARALGARLEEGDNIDEVAELSHDEEQVEEPAQKYDQSALPETANLDDREAALLLNRVGIPLVVTQLGIVVFANRALLSLSEDHTVADLMLRGGISELLDAQPRDEDGEVRATVLNAADGQKHPVDVSLQSILWQGAAASLWTIRARQPQDAAHSDIPTAPVPSTAKTSFTAEEYNELLNIAADCLILLDQQGQILMANERAARLLGRHHDHLNGKPLAELFPPAARRDLKAALRDTLDGTLGALKSTGLELALDGVDEHPRAVVVRLGLLKNTGDKPDDHKIAVIIRDISGFKAHEGALLAARAKAESASAHKSDFLARMSHEIRTPLNAILGFAQLMMDERIGPIGNARYREYLQDIYTSGEHVISLVNDLLDLAKIEAGKLDMNFTGVNLNGILQDCMDLMQPQAQSARVMLRKSFRPIPLVVADERSVRQIVLNILSNAIKFSGEHGQVLVSSALNDQGEALIRITDTGPGMSESDLKLALQPFKQLATHASTIGTGLGLPLTKALVEANRADFHIESVRGEGTTIEVVFPSNRVLAE